MTDGFGCTQCWPADAAAAAQVRQVLARQERLVDESHYGVSILGCPHCNQRFVSVFTETIDWEDGEDPQASTLLPLTEAEAADLVLRRSSLSEGDLNALAPQRRSLLSDFPKGATASLVFWGTGLLVGRHD